jgi:hypothetical protein
MRYQEGVDTTKLMQDVALYNEQVTGPEHAIIVGNRACRAALGDRGVETSTSSAGLLNFKARATLVRAADEEFSSRLLGQVIVPFIFRCRRNLNDDGRFQSRGSSGMRIAPCHKPTPVRCSRSNAKPSKRVPA